MTAKDFEKFQKEQEEREQEFLNQSTFKTKSRKGSEAASSTATRRTRKELSEVNLKLPKSKHLFRLDRGDVFNEGLNNLMQAPSKKGSQQARRIEEDFITSEDRLGMFDLKFVVPKLSRFDKASYEDLLKSDAEKAREREITE